MAIDKKQISQYTLYFIAAMLIAIVTYMSSLPSKKNVGKLWQKYNEVEKRISAVEAKCTGYDVGHKNVEGDISDLKDDIRRLRERIP